MFRSITKKDESLETLQNTVTRLQNQQSDLQWEINNTEKESGKLARLKSLHATCSANLETSIQARDRFFSATTSETAVPPLTRNNPKIIPY